MVTVRKLISELKKMPQTLEVGVAMHDNGSDEVAAWVHDVEEITQDFSRFEGFEDETGEKCVVLRC